MMLIIISMAFLIIIIMPACNNQPCFSTIMHWISALTRTEKLARVIRIALFRQCTVRISRIHAESMVAAKTNTHAQNGHDKIQI